jgi:hypothetical protein
MTISRRQWLKTGAAGALAAGVAGAEAVQAAQQPRAQAPARNPLFDKLQPLGDRVKPISVAEFQERVARAQQLMRDSNPKFDALYIAPGASMYYYFGVRCC